MNSYIHQADENEKDGEVKSRYLNNDKKKYLLAGVSQSVGNLNIEQTENLTKILITLKGEYDNLIREVYKKKNQTDEIGKQILMLEKQHNKFKDKVSDLEEQKYSYEINMEIQKKRYEEEQYAKSSYNHLIIRMKDDLHVIKKDINEGEIYSQKLDKQFEKEKIIESQIKEKLNQIHSHKLSSEQKIKKEKSDNDLILKYYSTIIHQKWSFIKGADERKLKQEQISLEAKNDTLDKQEVEKRKILHMLKFYNKFLKKKIQSQINDNKDLENSFIKIKNITVNFKFFD